VIKSRRSKQFQPINALPAKCVKHAAFFMGVIFTSVTGVEIISGYSEQKWTKRHKLLELNSSARKGCYVQGSPPRSKRTTTSSDAMSWSVLIWRAHTGRHDGPLDDERGARLALKERAHSRYVENSVA
jgi:hypothetical protein